MQVKISRAEIVYALDTIKSEKASDPDQILIKLIEGLRTLEALFRMNVLFQRYLDINQEVYACSIDFEKAFHKVKHDKLHRLLVSKNIDSEDVRTR